MNNPDDFPVDITEQRAWLVSHKQTTGMSWSQLGKASGIPNSTLSLFSNDSYTGRNDKVAREVFRYRQLIESQAERALGLPILPSFIKTATAMRIRSLLIMAQRGRITLGCTGPGGGKTITARDYRDSVANCWMVTMRPSTRSLNSMINSVAAALGGTVKQGWMRQMSAQIMHSVAGKGGLLIIDEANNLDFEALEELRSWHDETGVGICLLGNEELWKTIRGGARGHALARLNSRIGMSHVQDLPMPEDIEQYLDAANVTDPAQRAMLTKISMTPGAGGLREISQIIEAAGMLAFEDERPMSLGDLRDAQSMRATRYIKVAA